MATKENSTENTADTVPLTREQIAEIINNPEEYKRRLRYSFWVSDGKGWGYYQLVKSEEEVPKGKPFHVSICMG